MKENCIDKADLNSSQEKRQSYLYLNRYYSELFQREPAHRNTGGEKITRQEKIRIKKYGAKSNIYVYLWKDWSACSGIYDSWWEFLHWKSSIRLLKKKSWRGPVPGAFSIVVSQVSRLVWRAALRSQIELDAWINDGSNDSKASYSPRVCHWAAALNWFLTPSPGVVTDLNGLRLFSYTVKTEGLLLTRGPSLMTQRRAFIKLCIT